MTQTIVEALREEGVGQLFKMPTFATNFPVWCSVISRLAPAPHQAQRIFDLGDHLREIFNSTATNRTNAAVAQAGAAWEGLVSWYLNLCLIGHRTVILKNQVPRAVRLAMTATYNNVHSNSESDLVAVVFPDRPAYTGDKDSIQVTDSNGTPVPLRTRFGRYRLEEVRNALCERDFTELGVHVIQCKTSWADNAQIPMLWDMIYHAQAARRSPVRVGISGYSPSRLADFTYSFVTVPTQKDLTAFKPTSMAAKRVGSLSGGNYWGLPSRQGVALSVKEMLGRSLSNGHVHSHLTTLRSELSRLQSDYSYFGL